MQKPLMKEDIHITSTRQKMLKKNSSSNKLFPQLTSKVLKNGNIVMRVPFNYIRFFQTRTMINHSQKGTKKNKEVKESDIILFFISFRDGQV
jgi:hypothetical protein